MCMLLFMFPFAVALVQHWGDTYGAHVSPQLTVYMVTETLTILPSHPPHLPPICFIPQSSLFFLPYTSRRQSSGCASDIAQLSTTKYRTCIATFRNLANLGRMSNTTLENYCNMDCSNYLWNLLTKLARDCDPSNPVSHMKYTHMSAIASFPESYPDFVACMQYRKVGWVWYIIARESMTKFSEQNCGILCCSTFSSLTVAPPTPIR